MGKRIRKWMKGVLLTVIGLPIALVLIYVVIDTALSDEQSDRLANWILSFFVPIDDLEKADADYMLIRAQINRQQYDKALEVCDSLEGRTKMPQIFLEMNRALVYKLQNQPKVQEYYLRKGTESFTGTDYEAGFYSDAGSLLSQLLYEKNDYEGALKVLMPVIAISKEHESNVMTSASSPASLYMLMGMNLIALGRYDDGERNFQEALKVYKHIDSMYNLPEFETDSSYYQFNQFVAANASKAYLNAGLYDRAAAWLDVSKKSLSYIQEHCDSAYNNIDRQIFRQKLTEARILQHQGKKEEAEQLFMQYFDPHSDMLKITRLECGKFLLEAHHWQEAIDLYSYAGSAGNDSTQATLEDISMTLVPQYQAWRGMGNTQNAILLADSICGVIDSALVHERNSDAMELATIYDTQGKEAQIAQKEASLTRLWWVATTVVLGLVILSFIIYTIYRRRITKMRAVQDRIESELRIARDIQMSMVPNIFPDREGLDMYASMTPAKEVGGDLYGYLLYGDKLYFAVGDVSGKGVPASLFMAQATRLFLTLAKQGMMPAEICTRMNDALSGDDNESGMFVTFFVGLADLNTGHLSFCNAGHNPPVLDGQFIDMIPNAPIGLWPGLEYEGEETDCIKGRTLFIYTDGLNEAENTRQEQFSDEHLLEIIRNTQFDSARQMVERLKAEVDTHRNGAEPNDDLTMMGIMLRE